MFTYEYECSRGHRFDAARPMVERNEPTDCPDCEAPATLVMSMPAPAQFGWRLTEAAHERFGPREEVQKDV